MNLGSTDYINRNLLKIWWVRCKKDCSKIKNFGIVWINLKNPKLPIDVSRS